MGKRKLRTGFTTGTAAAAAVKGALTYYFSGRVPETICVPFLSEGHVDIEPASCLNEGEDGAVCTVVKDGGDDPDVTHKAVIGARIRVENGRGITITGGIGVGTVTKPGLEIEAGQPAINPGPLKMISDSVTSVLETFGKEAWVHVEIFVPEGEKLALKTLNSRLGILGGISILGTTGIERPMSHEAYIATIKSSLKVADASGCPSLVFTTGRRSERFSMELFADIPEEAFIQIGDFFKMSLDLAAEIDFKSVTLAVFFGKAVKMAQGVPHTHAAKSSLSLEKLSGWAFEITGNQGMREKILTMNTAREAFFYLKDDYPEVIRHVAALMIRSGREFAGSGIFIRAVIFDFDGQVAFDSGAETNE